jgi:hypothetical protein
MQKKKWFILGILAVVVLAYILVGVWENFSSKQETAAGDRDQVNDLTAGDSSSVSKVVSSDEIEFVWENQNDGILKIKKKPTQLYSLVVPEMFNGQKVTAFQAVKSDLQIEELVLPETVSCNDISGCKNLKSITCGPMSMILISACTNLEELHFVGTGYQNVAVMMLTDLPNLKSLELPQDLTELSYTLNSVGVSSLELAGQLETITNSVLDCSQLRYVQLGENVQTITSSFCACKSLRYVIIPKSVSTIKDSFYNCPNLTLVVEQNSTGEKYAKENDIPYILNTEFTEDLRTAAMDSESTSEALGNEKLDETVSDGEIIEISDESFFEIEDVSKTQTPDYILKMKKHIQQPYIVYFPNVLNEIEVTSIESVEDDPYIVGAVIPENIVGFGIQNCENLQWVKYSGTSNIVIIENCPKLERVVFPENLHVLSVSGIPAMKNTEIPDTVLKIVCSFRKDSFVEDIYIPDKVTSVEDSFTDCPNLTKVTVPKSVTSIESSFKNCPNLVLYVKKDSYAEQYALENGIAYVEDAS